MIEPPLGVLRADRDGLRIVECNNPLFLSGKHNTRQFIYIITFISKDLSIKQLY